MAATLQLNLASQLLPVMQAPDPAAPALLVPRAVEQVTRKRRQGDLALPSLHLHFMCALGCPQFLVEQMTASLQ